MRARPAVRRLQAGPLVLPARLLLLASGLLAVGLGTFTLLHERHSGQVDAVYLVVALIVGALWIACLVLAFLGFRIGIFGAAALAFADFGVTASTHFESGPGAIGGFVRSEGLPVATVAMGLVCACVLTVISATVAWSNLKGRNRRLDTLPLLLVALAGAVLVILQATDGVHRDNFGSANTEDGAFAAAITASLWLLGGLWIARVRRVGAVLIMLATFIVCYSFVTLHLLNGGTSLNEVAAKSGPAWAVFSAAAAVLAAASFLVALGLLALSILRRRRAGVPAGAQPAQRGA